MEKRILKWDKQQLEVAKNGLKIMKKSNPNGKEMIPKLGLKQNLA